MFITHIHIHTIILYFLCMKRCCSPNGKSKTTGIVWKNVLTKMSFIFVCKAYAKYTSESGHLTSCLGPAYNDFSHINSLKLQSTVSMCLMHLTFQIRVMANFASQSSMFIVFVHCSSFSGFQSGH